MAERVRRHDWSSTPLGPIEAWPASLKAIVDLMLGSPEAMCMIWGAGQTLIYNDHYAPLLDLRHPDALGRPLAEVWPEIWSDIAPLIDRALSGDPVSLEDMPLTMTRKGYAEETWWSFTYSPLRDETGAIAGMINITHDSTQRVLAGRRQAEAQARLDLTLSAGNGVGTWDWDVVSDRVTADARFAEIYGVDPELAKAGAPLQQFFHAIHPDDSERVSARIQQTLATDAPFRVEYRLVKADGSARWVVAEGGVVRDAEGNPLRFPGVTFDITEQREQDAALVEAETRYRTLFQTTETGFCIIEMKFEGDRAVDYQIVEGNAAYEQMTGLHGSTGKWVSDIAPGLEQHWYDLYGGVARTGEPVRFEQEAAIFGKWYDVQALRIGDPAQNRVAILFNDITRQRQTEMRHRVLLELNDLVRDMTDAEEIAHASSRILAEALNVSRVGYGVMDTEAETVTIARDWNAPGVNSIAGVIHFRDFGDYVENLVNGEVVVFADAADDPRVTDGGAALDTIAARALINLPLMEQGKVVALLFVNNATPRVWTDEDVALVREVAERVRVATERARNAAALQESEVRFRNIADHTPMKMWVTDPTGRCIYLNRRWYEFTGQTEEEAEGFGWLDATHPDDKQAANEIFMAANSAHEPFQLEYRLRRADGTYRWAIDVGSPRFDASGAYLGFAGSVVDIDDRRKTERALRESEARLRFLDDMTRAAQTAIDPEEILTILTRMTAEHLGVTNCAYADMDADQDGFTVRGDWAAPGTPSIVGHYSLADFGEKAVRELGAGRPLIINDNLKELPAHEAATFQAIGISATICMPLVKEGRLLALMAIHHRNPHDWTEAEQATIREVTTRCWAHIERVRDEIARRESEARYRTLFETMDEGFCIIEFVDGPRGDFDDYVHVEANAAYLANAGIADVVGQHVRDLVPDEAEEWIDLYREVLITGQPIRFEKELEATGRWLELAAFRVEPASRHQVAVLFKDLTARKLAARALEDLNLTLEARVTERTEELTRAHEALRQSQKMEAVGQLTGGIAHDFNNLLAGISGSLELLSKRLSEGRLNGMERYIDAAQGSAQRAASLTQRLLAFSRRQTLDPKPTDVNRLINGMEDLIRRSVGPDVEVEVVGAGGLWATRIDQSQLENALLNLCINARDAMAPAGGRLTIETSNKWLDDRAAHARDLPPGQYVSLCVTDTGTGMPPEVQAQAFDPFFTTKPLGQGTGLGLSMIHGFVRQSGGQVRIYSEMGKGTTMCLYLPRHQGDVEGDEIAGLTPVAEGGHGETVLIIDDEETVRMLVAEVLGEAGYNVIEAPDGPSGLEILRSNRRIDLLISDVGLPGGMNGRQVADAARETRPDLKVLFITGYAENAAVGNGLLAPGMEVLTKPFVMGDLAAKVHDMIEI